MFAKMTAELGKRRNSQKAKRTLGFGVCCRVSLATAHEILHTTLVQQVQVILFKMLSKSDLCYELHIAAVKTLPPDSVSQHFMVEPIMTRLIGSIRDFAVLEGAHVGLKVSVNVFMPSRRMPYRSEPIA